MTGAKQTGRAVTMPAGLMTGVIASMAVTLSGAAVTAKNAGSGDLGYRKNRIYRNGTSDPCSMDRFCSFQQKDQTKKAAGQSASRRMLFCRVARSDGFVVRRPVPRGRGDWSFDFMWLLVAHASEF